MPLLFFLPVILVSAGVSKVFLSFPGLVYRPPAPQGCSVGFGTADRAAAMDLPFTIVAEFRVIPVIVQHMDNVYLSEGSHIIHVPSVTPVMTAHSVLLSFMQNARHIPRSEPSRKTPVASSRRLPSLLRQVRSRSRTGIRLFFWDGLWQTM